MTELITGYALIATLTAIHAFIDGNGVVGSLIAFVICPIYWILYVSGRY